MTNSHRVAAVGLVGCLLASSAGVAQIVEGRGDGATTEEAPTDYETVVTPTRTDTTILDVDRNVQRVGEERLEQLMPVDVPDALDDVQGVSVQRTNRGAGAPILRGLIGPQNLIAIDGLRFNQSTFRTGPNQYLSLIDPYALDSIEVLLGSGSVLYGSNAMGGVINAIPIRAPLRDGWFGDASARFASADLGREVSATGGGRHSFISGYLGGSFRDHGDIRIGGGDELRDSNYRQGDWRGRIGFELGDGWTLTATYLGSRLENASRQDQVGLGDVRVYDNEDHFVYLDARLRDAASWLRDVRVAAVYHRTKEFVARTTCGTNDYGFVEDVNACLSLSDATTSRRRNYTDIVDTIGGLATARGWFWDGRFQVSLGAETYFDMVGSTLGDAKKKDGVFTFERKDRGNFSDDSTYLTAGAYAAFEGRPLVTDVGELVLTAGARVEHFRAKAPGVPGLGDIAYDDTGVVFSGGVRYILLNRYNFYVNFNQGFRSPNLQETTVLGDTGNNFEMPNDDLGAEKSNTIEAGVRMFTPWVSLTGAFYYTVIDDVIDRENATAEQCPPQGVFVDGTCQVDGKVAVRRVNALSATSMGTEFGFRTGAIQGVSLFGDLMYIHGEIEQRDGGTEPARRIPPLQGTIGVAYNSPANDVGIEWYAIFAAAQDRLGSEDRQDLRMCEDPTQKGRTRANCGEFDGWFTMGIRGRYTFDFGLDILAAVDNLMDQKYRVYGSGFDAPGINARVGIRYKY